MTTFAARTLALTATLGTLALSSGCAAMFTGTKSEVHFTSVPPGATVRVGDQTGTTPVTLKFKKDLKTAEFALPDQTLREVDLQRSFQGGFLFMDILFTPGFGLSGILVDGGTAAWFKHPAVIDCDFSKPQTAEPEQPESAAAAPVVAKQGLDGPF